MTYDYKKTAERLKALRTERGISHERMSDAIEKQYGVNMSKQTLINYENAEEFRTKAGAAKGMSAERLATLADYFGVSADYLLGISDSPSIRENMRIAQKTLGISATSAENISKVTREKRYPSMKLNAQRLGAALDLLLSSGALKEIAQSLYNLLDASEEMRRIGQWTVEDLQEQDLDSAEKDIEDAFSDYRLARLDLTESIQALMNGDTEHFVSAQDASGICERAYARCGEASALNAQETERAAEAHEAAYLQQLKEVGELGFCTFENDEKRAGIL